MATINDLLKAILMDRFKQGIRSQYPEYYLIAALELHTFSSLNENFLPLYKDSMNEADTACVYFNPHTLAHKKLPPLTAEKIKHFFNNETLNVFNDSAKLKTYIIEKAKQHQKTLNILLMSSGNFDGIVFEELANSIF